MTAVTPKPAATTPTAKMIRMLGAVSLACGLLIVGTNLLTFNRIRSNTEVIMKESIAELLPSIDKQVVYRIEANGELTILHGLEGEGQRLFAGFDAAGKFLGVVLEANGRGYADVIVAMYAYAPESKTITGFKVVEMHETPGLGDRIGSDPQFAENFKALDTSHAIAAVKHGTKKSPWEIDALSGATISSRAVGRMLQKSIEELGPVVTKNLDRIKKGN